MDETALPYFVIRNYIAPRAYARFIVIPVDPQELLYSITQINGVRLPRYILLQQQTTLPNIEELGKLVIIRSAEGLKTLEKNFTIILNSGTLIFVIFIG